MNNERKTIFSVFVLAIAVILISRLVVKKPDASAGALDAFAQCLTQKGVVMYGAEWCPVCQSEKKAFGDSFRFILYVECSKEPKKCIDAGVGGYPTWIFPDGRKLEGGQGIEKLSQESGCPLR